MRGIFTNGGGKQTILSCFFFKVEKPWNSIHYESRFGFDEWEFSAKLSALAQLDLSAFRSAILQSKEAIFYFFRNTDLGSGIARPQTAALQTYKVFNVTLVYTFQNITMLFAIPSLLLTKAKATWNKAYESN